MALRPSTETGQPQAGRTVTIDPALPRKAAAELLGTALLVFFGCGVATVTFGFHAFGSSVAAGVVASSLSFGLVMTAMVALVGPISGGHINPAVTLGAFLSRRISLMDAAGYWIAQFVGGVLGALLLLWVLHTSPFYFKSRIGLGANGWGSSPVSLLRVSGGGAFLIEVIITAVFVLVVLAATHRTANAAISGAVIGLTLGLANLVATPVDGASVNPARSFGPALVTAGQPIRQVWLFILAPLVGAVLAAGIYLLFHPMQAGETGAASTRFGQRRAQPAVSQAGADEGARPAGSTTTPAGDPGSAAAGRAPAGPGRGAASGTGGLPVRTDQGNPGDPEAPASGSGRRLPARSPGVAAMLGRLAACGPTRP